MLTNKFGNLPFTGLYSEQETAHQAALIHCSIEASLHGLQNRVSLGLLFQNTTDQDFEDALFHCRLDDDATVVSFSCAVEKHQQEQENPRHRFEKRECSREIRYGKFYQCHVGRVRARKDAVVFIRYVTGVAADRNTVSLSVPLPGQTWKEKRRIQLDKEAYKAPVVMESTNFSISVVSTLPGQIRAVRSETHCIQPHIEDNVARVEVNEAVSPEQESVQMTFFADNLCDDNENTYVSETDTSELSDFAGFDSDADVESEVSECLSFSSVATLPTPELDETPEIKEPWWWSPDSPYNEELMSTSFLWLEDDDDDEDIVEDYTRTKLASSFRQSSNTFGLPNSRKGSAVTELMEVYPEVMADEEYTGDVEDSDSDLESTCSFTATALSTRRSRAKLVDVSDAPEPATPSIPSFRVLAPSPRCNDTKERVGQWISTDQKTMWA